MFIKRIKSAKGTEYFQLAKSYRKGKNVYHKTLLNLGKEGDGQLDSLIQAIYRYSGCVSLEKAAEDMDAKQTYILGPLLILKKLFERLGINKTLEGLPKGRTSCDLQKILFTLVASRFIDPGSKLKVFERHKELFYPVLFKSDIQLHQIYRALDILAKNKDEIEKSLYWQGRDLFNYQVDVVLYDLTTLRFESQRTNLGKLRQFGYSKERRGDMVQCVLGLLVDRDGLPLGFELYAGNTFEGKTVSDIERKLKKKFNVRRFIFVGDRGLFSKKNLESLNQGSGEFIVGMKLGAIKSRHEEFYDKSRFKKVHKGLSVYESDYEGHRLIIMWSAERAKRDRKAREETLLKVKKKLASKSEEGKQFITNEAYRKYVCLKGKGGKPVLNQKAIEREERSEGFFGVVTNVRDKKASDLVSHYKELWKVESAFGELKGTLKVRPIFHWTDQRIMGHLLVCFIAYLCEAYLTKELRKKGSQLKSEAISQGLISPRLLTVAEGMKDLCEVRAVPFEIKDSVIWLRTNIKDNAAEMFRVAKVQIPKKLLMFSPGGKAVKALNFSS